MAGREAGRERERLRGDKEMANMREDCYGNILR